MEPGEPIVRPGEYRRTFKFHFYADSEQLQQAARGDYRVPEWLTKVGLNGYHVNREVHVVMPVAGDPFGICILGHEVLHGLTHAPGGQWHFPLLGQECSVYLED